MYAHPFDEVIARPAILCRMCNVSLGGFRDNPTLLRKAARYIEKYRPSKPKRRTAVTPEVDPRQLKPIDV